MVHSASTSIGLPVPLGGPDRQDSDRMIMERDCCPSVIQGTTPEVKNELA